jgi:CubicO group peptidase (beta-lactamase class C family)
MERDVQYAGADDDAPGTTMQKRQAWAEKILARAPVNAAGVQQYSNSGFIVAGAMLEARAGISWEVLLTNRVFAPLGMTHSGFGEPATPGTLDQPYGHLSGSGGFDPKPPGSANPITPLAIGPAGAVHTTLDDIALYLAAHLEGERGTSGLLTTESFVALHAPVAAGYALGWVDEPKFMPFDTPGNWHNGSNGWWYAQLWFVPSCDCAAFVATNGGGERANAAVSALDKLLRDRIFASP